MLIAFSACEKKEVYNEETQFAIDEALIKNWVDSTGLDFQRHESGLYYEILDEGEGDHPELSDSLTVEYEGRMLGDSVAFSNADDLRPYEFLLQHSIPGWKIGLPLIKKDGRIRLLVPSPLGYRDYKVGRVPKNTVLDFTIDLKEIVKNN